MKLTKPFKGVYVVHQAFHAKHDGIDLGSPRWVAGYGTPLTAPEDVVIERVVTPGYLVEDGNFELLKKGYGLRMRGLETGNLYLYWHCLPGFPVWGGDKVKRGQIVAYMGNSGNVRSSAYGPSVPPVPLEDRTNRSKNFPGTHLHMEVVVKGKKVDPFPLFDWTAEPTYTNMDILAAAAKVIGKFKLILK